MKLVQIIKGDRYGRFTVIKEAEPFIYKGMTLRTAMCRCDCGTIKKVRLGSLRSGSATSCGCYRNELTSALGKSRKGVFGLGKHNMSHSSTYGSWRAMKYRCTNKSHFAYEHYRNIKICDRWFDSFINFYEDMGERPKGKSLDRIDGTQGYSKENCRWATAEEQANNQISNVVIEYEGEQFTIAGLARKFNLKYTTVRERIRRGKKGKEITKDIDECFKNRAKKIRLI